MRTRGEHRWPVERTYGQKNSSKAATLFRFSSRRTRARDALSGGEYSFRKYWVRKRWMDWLRRVYRPAVLDRGASGATPLGPLDVLASDVLAFVYPLFHIRRDSARVSAMAHHLVLADHSCRGWRDWNHHRVDFSGRSHKASSDEEALKGRAFQARRTNAIKESRL